MSKKAIVLQTTLELITKQGIRATSLSQIIKTSGVANGTLYHHFKNKEEIISELYLMLSQDFGTVVMRNLPEEDTKKQFAIMWQNLFYYFVNNPLAFIFSEQIARSPEIPTSLKNQARQYYKDIEAFFRETIRKKEFKAYDILVMEELFFGNVVSLVKLYENKGGNLKERCINQAIEISWKGFLKKAE
ncbi:TetR/AcrR family transcriptional regulator [Aquimarina hainanensis]|uniref:TetR/AcrR family transcriptional regulator n=1 Tax=Aquimarina hainanensis TaxID=1578017 RepID=A0ABW5N343_9FLAO|nr:TetR/AcrR family transcriptional regulator [Aquimarina sp. TRL1]QKX04305.1 TetR/AcrR family transcriptional regulator [Aquimarina sp. TRL1]